MDGVMSSGGSDFEERFFKLLLDRMDKQDETLKKHGSKLEQIHEQTQKTNGRVTKLESQVNQPRVISDAAIKKNLPSPWRDPKVIQIFLYLSIALLLLVSAAVKFDVGRVL